MKPTLHKTAPRALMIVAALAFAAPTVAADDPLPTVPISVPGGTIADVKVPALVTEIPGQTVNTPEVQVPPCNLSLCTSPLAELDALQLLTIPGQTITTPQVPLTVPEVPGLVHNNCVADPIICIPAAIAPQTITTGAIPVGTPGVTLPAPCSITSALCAPLTTVGSKTVSTSSIPVTQPAMQAQVTISNLTGHIGSTDQVFYTLPPISIDLPIFTEPVLICPAGSTDCQVRLPASFHGTFTVTVVIGGVRHTQTLPADIG